MFMCNLLTVENENRTFFAEPFRCFAILPLRHCVEVGKYFEYTSKLLISNINHKKSNGHLFHVNTAIK